MSGHPASRQGFLLPIALLLILALSATSLSVLILTRTEVLSEGGDHRYLRDRVTEEARLAAPWGASSGGGGGGGGAGGGGVPVEGVTQIPLAGGYILVRAQLRGLGGEEAPSNSAIYWRLNPELAAYTLLPGAVEVGGGGVPGGAVRAMTHAEGCPLTPSGAPLVRVRPSESAPPPNPPLPLPPRLGPVGFGELLDLPATLLALEGGFPREEDASPVLRAGSGARVLGGRGGRVLLAEGNLHLGGSAHFRGIVLVGGDLFMEDGATIEGVALVGGRVYLSGGSSILGCPGLAAAALNHPDLTRPRAIRGGEMLGRF